MSDPTQSDAIHAYLVGLYGENPNGLLWIGGHADGWKGRTFATTDAATRYAVELDARGGSGVYHRSTTLARVPDRRGEAGDTAAVYYFALDVDIKGPGHKAEDLPLSMEDAVRLIETAGFPAPTYWVHSGGGLYPQWRFTEPIDVQAADVRAWVTSAFAAMAAHFIAVARDEFGWSLDNVRDLARVFRLPGTTNRKADPVIAAAVDGSGERFDLGVLASIAHRAATKARESAPTAASATVAGGAGPGMFDDVPDDNRHTEAQAKARIESAFARMRDSFGPENFNVPINHFAKFCSHFPWLVDRDECARIVTKALTKHGRTADDNDYRTTIDSAYRSTEAGRDPKADWVATKVEVSQSAAVIAPDAERLRITSAADMAYWLEENAGTGRLSGLFQRNGVIVHTPRVNELGYVPAPEGADNGPAEIRPMAGPVLAAKIQYLFRCYKVVDAKDETGKKTGEKVEVAALFPKEAASVAVDAPEALTALRPLAGITSTPMVRADGSLLEAPGYDPASGFLFLPGPGVAVPAVPDRPDVADVERARGLLLRMISDFPFATDDDRANYLGLLLTPLLRQVAPPSYKLFGIGAHQPGSGKSLLAELASVIHGGVLRADVPTEEDEWRKETMAILSTTSAPLIVLDNIMGVLKSSTLAGLLTAGREVTSRELGKNTSNITVANDRVWVVTGNNLSLGGDLVRRTITILIDPDTPNPEQRTTFAIADLKAWVTEHRNEVLWALLVLIRTWVVAGMPEAARKQSDSFARWERVVAGVLAVAGVPGEFDAESGKRAATGGDDDGLFRLLGVLRERFGDKVWTTAEAMEPKSEDGDFLIEGRDWLPGVVLDKIGRSEASARLTFGRWLQNRVGRWVSEDGTALVLRHVRKSKRYGVEWRVEER